MGQITDEEITEIAETLRDLSEGEAGSPLFRWLCMCVAITFEQVLAGYVDIELAWAALVLLCDVSLMEMETDGSC